MKRSSCGRRPVTVAPDMKLRQALRFLHRVAGFLRVPDTRVVRPAGRVILLSCNDVDRGMRQGGQRFSPLLEGIRELVIELGYTPVNFSHPFAVFRSEQIKDGTFTLNRRAFRARLRTAWLRLTRPEDVAAARVEREAALYHNLLKTLRPEVVFAIQPPWAMCHAARQLGIAVVEAMHGSNVSLDDRIFAEHMAHPDHMLPHCVLGFDEVTFATFSTHCEGRDIVALRANDPWIQACRRRRARERKAAGTSGSDADRSGKSVLVSLQWGYDGERPSLSGIIPNGILHPAIEGAMAKTAGSGIRFLVRLHPIQMTSPGYRHHRRYVESLASRFPHVEAQRATDDPLPLLLDDAACHITMSSSSVGEATAAGVPSLMLCPTLHPGGAHAGFFKELEREGVVTFGRLEADAIVDWIDRWGSASERPKSTHYTESVHQAELSFYASLIERARTAAKTDDRETATSGTAP
jgi:hypothetical protein